jgi:hypothetical protein
MDANWKTARYYGNFTAKIGSLTLTVNFLAPQGWFAYIGSEIISGCPFLTYQDAEKACEDYAKIRFPNQWKFVGLTKPVIFIPADSHQQINGFPDLPSNGRGRL